jgi:UDPglucose 6-dehydrogenase
VQHVSKGIGMDGRIGSKFLHAGPGYGGSCFPKDTLALSRTAQQYKSPLRIVDAVIEANNHRKQRMSQKVINACKGSVLGKTVAVLGLTFKPNTDDMRASPSIDVIIGLQEAGAKIKAYDPAGMGQAKILLEDILWCSSAYDAMENADAVVINR